LSKCCDDPLRPPDFTGLGLLAGIKSTGSTTRMNTRLLSRRMKIALTIASLVLLSVSQTSACTLAIGYFYQVTALKGRVVGTHNLTYAPRWFRQSFVRKHAKLSLYEYGQGANETSIVNAVETDGHGNFDFGPLKIGHYALRIDDNYEFDVEVKELPRITASVTIDVSPIHPDCKGGHEFIVRTQ